MKVSTPYVFVAILLALVPASSIAYVGPPYITPDSPTTSTPISVRVPAGNCHAFVDQINEAELVTIGPGQLQLIADGIALSPGHPFCIYPEYTYRFDIGALPAGTYQLEVVLRDDESFINPIALNVGTLPLVVSQPARVPAMSSGAASVIAGMLLVSGFVALRVRFSS